jgi:hypothetical protein
MGMKESKYHFYHIQLVQVNHKPQSKFKGKRNRLHLVMAQHIHTGRKD